MQLRVRQVDAADSAMLPPPGGDAAYPDETRLSVVFEVEDTGKGVPEQ